MAVVRLVLLSTLLLSITAAHAEPVVLNLDQALEKALSHDPRISEMEALVRSAQAMLKEVEGSDDARAVVNSFIGLSPAVTGEFFSDKNCGGASSPCTSRRDRYTLEEGVSLWNYMDYRVIKPIYTFGKIEHYSSAAKANIKVKENDVRLQRANTLYDVKRAYFGHLAARDTRLFLEDMKSRVDSALELVNGWLEEGEGQAKQTDLYALQTATELAQSYINQARAMEAISLSGLKVLTGVVEELQLFDKRLTPVELPTETLALLQEKALLQRPEMSQLEQGLKARRSLMNANKAMNRPNIFVGFAGMLSYSPGRDRLDNPHIYDPFSDAGGTPIVGMQWEYQGGVMGARAAREKAEFEALVEKSSFAKSGIPFQVAESYEQVQAFSQSVKNMERSARAARRWMISTYTDFEAGIEQADKIVGAFQGYVLAYTKYLETVYEYNMHVAQLTNVVGAYQ